MGDQRAGTTSPHRNRIVPAPSATRCVVDLGRQGGEEAVPSEFCVPAGYDVPDHATDEGASVEDEGESDQPGLVVVAAEGPPHKAGHSTRSPPHPVLGYDLPAHSILACPPM